MYRSIKLQELLILPLTLINPWCLLRILWLNAHCSPKYKLLLSFFPIMELCVSESNESNFCLLVPGYVPWVYGYNRGSNFLEIKWSSIPENDAHGILLGYVVYFRRYGSYEIFGKVKVNAGTLVLRITGLSEATRYEIKVAGRTSVGEGPLRTTYVNTGW